MGFLLVHQLKDIQNHPLAYSANKKKSIPMFLKPLIQLNTLY